MREAMTLRAVSITMAKIALALGALTAGLITVLFGLAEIGAQNNLQVFAWAGPLGSAAIVTSVCFAGAGVISGLERVCDLLGESNKAQQQMVDLIQSTQQSSALGAATATEVSRQQMVDLIQSTQQSSALGAATATEVSRPDRNVQSDPAQAAPHPRSWQAIKARSVDIVQIPDA